ncbi:MAG: response regulator [Myxococcales bacterium]|nr:response regulator [Myxococcales bacterium]
MAGDNRIRVLLVEDDPQDVVITRRALARTGAVEVDLTHVDRLAALPDAVERGMPDVVLLDLTLPDCAGLDTLTRARSLLDDVPMIVLTGLDDEQLGVEALRQGAEDYVRKGTAEMATLERSVRYALERRAFRERDGSDGLYDARTGLPTRTIFVDRLTMAMRRADLGTASLAVALVRLDELHRVAGQHGQLAADIFERALLKRLTSALRLADTLAVFGEGEYACIIEGPLDAAHPDALARLLGRACGEPVQVPTIGAGAIEIRPRAAAIGVALYPEDGRTVRQLLVSTMRRMTSPAEAVAQSA